MKYISAAQLVVALILVWLIWGQRQKEHLVVGPCFYSEPGIQVYRGGDAITHCIPCSYALPNIRPIGCEGITKTALPAASHTITPAFVPKRRYARR